MLESIWHVRSIETDYEWEGALEAYWEVSHDPLSDDYTPGDISARELFALWASVVQEEYKDGLIPIWWYVQCLDQGKLDAMPHRLHPQGAIFQDDFLASFTWPTEKHTGKRLNWLELPVVDKLWNSHSVAKGGFIQQLTGWKPGILQPFVFLPTLLMAAELDLCRGTIAETN
jgi:hypothetical protein